MTQEKFDNVCKTFIKVVLEPNLRKDEPDANYKFEYSFDETHFQIIFTAFKLRNPKYALSIQTMDCGSYDSYLLEKRYDDYMEIRDRLTSEEWHNVV